MSSLFGSMSIAMRALMAQQGALQITSQNIANVNTPGYSRQVPVLEEDTPYLYGGALFGTGVSLAKVISIRDRILDLRIYQETQQQGQASAYLASAKQVESLFSLDDQSGIGNALDGFFNSLSALSASPSSLAARQAVLAAARSLASAIQGADAQLRQVQRSLDGSIGDAVSSINSLTARIAELNSQVAAAQAAGQNSGVLEDQRDQLIAQLSNLFDVSVIDAGGGKLTLTSTAGIALVVGDTANQLTVAPDPTTGHAMIFSQGGDITASISGGRIGGMLAARDKFITSVESGLDDLAASLTQSFNTQHRAGFDLSGAAGGDFFTPFTPPASGSNAGAAAAFSVALSDPGAIAASADGAPGDNGNLAALLALRNQALVGGQTASEYYAGLVAAVGGEVADASAEEQAGGLALMQLQNQKASVSQVSLDEEATNLMRYQRAFEAAARVINVVDELTQTALSIGRS